MKSDIIAPWAEAVPDAPSPMTIAQLRVLPDDAWQYELVEGRLVRMPSSESQASSIAVYLASILIAFVRPGKLGRVSGADGQYNLTPPGAPTATVLIPDVAFVRAGRLAQLATQEASAIPHLAADLVGEVAAPSQHRAEMATKARRYIQAGVRLVWVVWPDAQEVEVWRPGHEEPVRVLGVADALDGLDVLPGFTHPVADLFAE
jgi:Uma2 family endonuclease